MRATRMIVAVLMGTLTCGLAAQQNSEAERASAIPESDKSPYIGRPVADPEGLSGLWEVSNGHGGAAGIHLMLATSAAPDAKGDGKTLAGVEQLWESLAVGVYERRGSTLVFGEENFFSDRSSGTRVKVEDGRLQLHFVSQWADKPSVDLDLANQPGDQWVGRLHRGNFDSEVTLMRPGAELKTDSAIKGTWAATGITDVCMHIVEQAPSVFTGWSDSLQIPGKILFGPSVLPHRLWEFYGGLMKVQVGTDGNASFEFGAFSAMCCSHTFVGRQGVDGRTIEGAWPPGPNQAPRSGMWKKMAGSSCMEENSARDRRKDQGY